MYKQINGSNNDAVNTRELQFYNKKSEEPSTLALGSWNELLFSRLTITAKKKKYTSSIRVKEC